MNSDAVQLRMVRLAMDVAHRAAYVALFAGLAAPAVVAMRGPHKVMFCVGYALSLAVSAMALALWKVTRDSRGMLVFAGALLIWFTTLMVVAPLRHGLERVGDSISNSLRHDR